MNTIFRKILTTHNYIIIIALSFLPALLLFSGCGTNRDSLGTETAVEASEAPLIQSNDELPGSTGTSGMTDDTDNFTDIPAPLTDYVSEEYMALADMWASCDDAALAAVMRKAVSGDPVTIACIGGSITQGTISAGSDDSTLDFKKCYADLFFQWWETACPDTEFTYINAGIGATDSYLGVHRVKQDVLDANPDLVLVEFSVNDGTSSIDKRNYDNLVRRILLSDNHPAVMLLFMGQTNGSSAQDIHSLIGFNYKLPMVSYINVINRMMDEHAYNAKQLSGDTTHPSALGHAIAGEILWKYLNNVYSQRDSFDEPKPFTQSAVTNDVYLDSEIIDSASLAPADLGTFEESSAFEAFPNDYTCSEGNGGLTFTVNCKRLGILYYRTTDGNGGQFEVYINGEYATTLDADFSGGWGNYAETAEVLVSDEAAEYTIEIRKAADSSGNEFTLLGVLTAH